MVTKITRGFWAKVARIILRNRILILFLIVAATVFLAFQWKNMQFSTSEANLLPDDHPLNLAYEDFLEKFGEEGNTIAFAIKDSSLYEVENFNKWNRLNKQLAAFPEVDYVVSIDNLKELIRDKEEQQFILRPLIEKAPLNNVEVDSLIQYMFNNLPFYDNLLYNKETGTIRTLVYMDKDIVNTPVRKDFILKDLHTLITDFEKESKMDVRVSGMPYIRTMNTQHIIDEIGIFINFLFLFP